MKSYTINCISEAVSPITHMSGSAGNEGIVAREPVHTDRGIMMVPFLSGNAIRHRFVRRPLAMWIVDRYELHRKLSLAQLNLLMHGGNLTQSNSHENTRRIAEMHECLPMLRLLGASLPDQILSGSLHVWRGVLICQENRQYVESHVSLPRKRLLSCERFLGGYQYTRGDAAKTALADPNDRDDMDAGKSNLMIYSGQSVMRGAMFHHGFVVEHVSEVELGCLLLALRLWQASGGTIGGNSRLGHGRLRLSLVDFVDDDKVVEAFVDYADSMRERATAWLQDAFASAKASKERKEASKASKVKPAKKTSLPTLLDSIDE